jgi:Tfp pilus assembly protein PilZ
VSIVNPMTPPRRETPRNAAESGAPALVRVVQPSAQMEPDALADDSPLVRELRRAHQRALLEVAVTLESDNNFYTGITNDISEGGVFIAIDEPPPIGNEIGFELRLHEDGPVWQVIGVVRWVRTMDAACDGYPAGCGVEWIWIPARALTAIAAFVARRETVFWEA